MIKMSKLPFKTLKSKPKTSDNKSTSLLLQAWFIRQVMAWVYTYTTLWYEVLNNIKDIIREEMNNAWCFETYMPGLSPREFWDKTWRWEIEDYFSLKWHGEKDYRLNPTHEEIVVPLMQDFINSYKDNDTCVYQIKDKYRNEKRAKSWLLRWRDFLMKDAYSFHCDNESFEDFYDKMKIAYMNVFKRVWLWKDTYITIADGWVFTEKYSHEFQTILSIWEDIIYIDEQTWNSYNQEVAPAKIWTPNIADKQLLQKQDIKHDESIIWVDALEKALWVPKIKTTKTMFFETDDDRFIVACVRWDYDINLLKLRKIIWCKDLKLASEQRVLLETWANIGFAWIINLPDNVELYIDDSVDWMTNFETWTNKTWFHSINVNFWVDLKFPEKFYDFKDAKSWDKNPQTWNVYIVEKACEVGNIFPLETKYTKPFGMKFTDENNKEQDFIMWCYGIWVSRVMWVIAEYFCDEKTINWPENIAPASYYIIVIWENNLEKALKLVYELENKWEKVILDDRFSNKIWFWQKAWDSELFWIPNRIVISDKTLEKGWYELKKRNSEEVEIIPYS